MDFFIYESIQEYFVALVAILTNNFCAKFFLLRVYSIADNKETLSSLPKMERGGGSSSALANVVEISPYQRYIRFNNIIGQSGNLGTSYKAFDTINAIEVDWHIICFNDLMAADCERMTRSANVLKRIQNKHIVEYLTCWVVAESKRFNIITAHLPSLKE